VPFNPMSYLVRLRGAGYHELTVERLREITNTSPASIEGLTMAAFA